MNTPPPEDNPARWHFQPGLEITVPEAAKLHSQSGAKDFLLVDIREPDELAVAAIEGARHIPMGDIPARIGELDVDEDTTIAVICHSGRRSLKTAMFLQQQGLSGARSVAGGIDWWSIRIDPGVPRY